MFQSHCLCKHPHNLTSLLQFKDKKEQYFYCEIQESHSDNFTIPTRCETKHLSPREIFLRHSF